MALQMSRMAIFQTAAWRALWIKALMFNRTTLSAIRIFLSPNAGTLIATCGGQQGRTQKGAPSRRTGGSRDGADEADDSDVEPSLGSFDRMADHKAWRQKFGELCLSADAEQDDADRKDSDPAAES
jgi:hypothetical protein